MLAALLLALVPFQEPVHLVVPIHALELEEGAVLPRYEGLLPWEHWIRDVLQLPRAALDGPGEVVYRSRDEAPGEWRVHGPEGLGELHLRLPTPREVTGTLFVPRASGGGFTKVRFRVPAGAAAHASDAAAFADAERERYQRLATARLPGGAWFRHRLEALGGAVPDERDAWRGPENTMALFTGGRALWENLQLERGIGASDEAERTVPVDGLEGITVRAFDWKPLRGDDAPELDPLAELVPADQHAVFFPSFDAFVAVLDEAARLGELGVTALEDRASDARTRAGLERQLCLELDALARALGGQAIESVAITGSDPYLRSGSDVALLLRAKDAGALAAFVRARHAAARDAAEDVHDVADPALGGVANPSRSVSSYLAVLGGVVVVSNSPAQLARLTDTAGERLAGTDEYRFFRQRYARGDAGESAFVVLTDAAIRRWCSPRWRIGAERRVRAAAGLAELHAEHADELLGDVDARVLGTSSDFPGLGELAIGPEGVRSAEHGTLDFLTPIAELAIDRATEREAGLYRQWRDGYERAWSQAFDPIAARLSLGADGLALDLTVMPLILGTEYADLREMTNGPGLGAGDGDLHAEALVHFAMAIDREWEPLRSAGETLGPAAEALGADPLGWLGGWLAVYLDDGELWDDLEDAEDAQEAFETLRDDPSALPLAITIAVEKPLQLALFMTGLRTFVDGTAPGMTVWEERVVGEHRFVQIGSPGFGDPFRILYATTPEALVLSLNEPTLLRAMDRIARRRAEAAGALPAGAARVEPGAHVRLEVRKRALEHLERLLDGSLADESRDACWRNLPILNEWRRLHPDLDPVEVHERVFRERLVCPASGEYVWDEEWRTMASSAHGHPGAPLETRGVPQAWRGFRGVRSHLRFEHDGLRVWLELERE